MAHDRAHGLAHCGIIAMDRAGGALRFAHAAGAAIDALECVGGKRLAIRADWPPPARIVMGAAIQRDHAMDCFPLAGKTAVWGFRLIHRANLHQNGFSPSYAADRGWLYITFSAPSILLASNSAFPACAKAMAEWCGNRCSIST